MAYEFLMYDVTDQVATLTLNRPERLNALNSGLRVDIHNAITEADSDPDVRAIVITGAGRGFCSGGDVKAMAEANESGRDSALEDRVAPARDKAVLAMRDTSKPTIAAVNGAAAGAGMNIALGCDIRIASTSAKFAQSFAKRGLHPDWGGTYFLPRVVGMAKACELIFTGKVIDAEEALRLGIVSQVTEPGELMPTVMDLAKEFVDSAPIAIRLAKRAMYRGMECSLREALEFETYAQNICKETEDHKEGARAFVEKREPNFVGR